MSVLDEVRNKLKEEEDAVLPEPSTSSRPRKSQSSVARRRTAFKSASRSQQSGAIGLIALAGGAFFLWRWWKNRQSQPKNASGNAAQQVGGKQDAMHARMLAMDMYHGHHACTYHHASNCSPSIPWLGQCRTYLAVNHGPLQAASTSGKGKQSKGSAFSFDRKDKKAALKAVAEQPSLQAVVSHCLGCDPGQPVPVLTQQ